MDSSESKDAGYGSVGPAMGADRNGRCHSSALAVVGSIIMLLVCMAALTDTNSSRTVLWSDPLANQERERGMAERDIIRREGTHWWKSDLHNAWSDPMVGEEERRRSQAHNVVQRGPAISQKHTEPRHPEVVSHRTKLSLALSKGRC